jgi:hypothetical protein
MSTVTDCLLRRLCDKAPLRPYDPLHRLGVVQGKAGQPSHHGGPGHSGPPTGELGAFLGIPAVSLGMSSSVFRTPAARDQLTDTVATDKSD